MAGHGIGRRKFTERELERRLHARVEASLACAVAYWALAYGLGLELLAVWLVVAQVALAGSAVAYGVRLRRAIRRGGGLPSVSARTALAAAAAVIWRFRDASCSFVEPGVIRIEDPAKSGVPVDDQLRMQAMALASRERRKALDEAAAAIMSVRSAIREVVEE